MKNFKALAKSDKFFRLILGVGIVFVALLIFAAGVSVGSGKADFDRAWDEHYGENFGIGPRGMGPGMMTSVHGAAGKIVQISLPQIVVSDANNVEKPILISEDTQIQKLKETITADGLAVNDFVVVLGSPDDKGFVEAKFIRVLPRPDLIK